MKQPDNTADLAQLVRGVMAHVAALQRAGLRIAGGTAAGAQAAPAQAAPAETLEAVRADLGACQRCSLCSARNTIVFGQGSPKARLVFVGAAPSATDDAEGRPFCGPEGELLSKIIQAIKLSRSDVYLTHTVKCAPPAGRLPDSAEAGACLPFLSRQLAAIGPAIVCALGEFAAQALLGTAEPLHRLRGRFHEAGGMLVMPTYDPAYLILHEEKKRQTWDDLKMVMKEYGRAAAD